MSTEGFIDISSIKYTDFYDQILYRYYGRKTVTEDSGWYVTMYSWNGKHYMDKMVEI